LWFAASDWAGMWSRKDGKVAESCTAFLDMVARRRSWRGREVITGMEAKEVGEVWLEQQTGPECGQVGIVITRS